MSKVGGSAPKTRNAKKKSAGNVDKTRRGGQSSSSSQRPQTQKQSKSSSAPKKKAKTKDLQAESVDSFASRLADSKTGWFESFSGPLWLEAVTFTGSSLKEFLGIQASWWVSNGRPADPLTLDWSGQEGFETLTRTDLVIAFFAGSAVSEKDVKEVFRLTPQFLSSEDFVKACDQAFSETSTTALYRIDNCYGCILSLCFAPAKLRRIVREYAQNLMKKEAKVPTEVTDFEAEIHSINSVLKDQDRKFQNELKTLQEAVKRKLEEKESFEKETSEFRIFTKEYYGVRSGKLDNTTKIALVDKYNENENLRSKYTLEQFINLYGQSSSIKRVQSKLNSFRSSQGFEKGRQWLANIKEDQKDEADESDESMGQEEDEAALDSDILDQMDS